MSKQKRDAGLGGKRKKDRFPKKKQVDKINIDNDDDTLTEVESSCNNSIFWG